MTGRFGQWSNGVITLLCQGALHLLVGERGTPTHGFTPEHEEKRHTDQNIAVKLSSSRSEIIKTRSSYFNS